MHRHFLREEHMASQDLIRSKIPSLWSTICIIKVLSLGLAEHFSFANRPKTRHSNANLRWATSSIDKISWDSLQKTISKESIREMRYSSWNRRYKALANFMAIRLGLTEVAVQGWLGTQAGLQKNPSRHLPNPAPREQLPKEDPETVIIHPLNSQASRRALVVPRKHGAGSRDF